MKRLALFLAALALTSAAAAQSAGLKGLDDAWARAANANDLEAMVSLYAADAVLYPPDGFEVRGRDAIRQHLRPMFDHNTLSDVGFVDTRYETRGDISTGWGVFKMTLTPKTGGESTAMRGRFTAVAKKTGGKWLYIADHASMPPAPPPAQVAEKP